MRYHTGKLSAAYLLLLAVILGNTACTAVLFQPTREMVPIPERFHVVYQDYYFKSKDGLKLHGWYFPANPQDGETIKHKKLLFLHGNANNISNHYRAIAWLAFRGYDTYIFDYRGYGQSEGLQDLEGSFLDIEAAIAYVDSQGQPSDKFIIMGQSLGASMGIYAISQSQYKSHLSAYICVAGFSDYRQIVRDFLSRNWFTWLLQWPLSLTINNDYAPVEYISQLSPVPVYFLAGESDEVIPNYHTQVLYDAALQPKQIKILARGHNEFFLDINNRKQVLAILDSL